MKVDPGNGVNFLIMRTFHVLIVVFLLGACARRQPVPETVRPVKVTMAAGAALIDKDFAGLATPDAAVNLAILFLGLLFFGIVSSACFLLCFVCVFIGVLFIF